MSVKSIHHIIKEDDFVPLVQTTSTRLFKILNYLDKNRSQPTRKFFSNLMTEAEFVEFFLDDYGARENIRWFFFAELVASIRNYGISSFHLKHVIDRYSDYDPKDSEEFRRDFLEEAEKVLLIFGKIIHRLYTMLRKEAASLGMEITVEQARDEEFKEIQVTSKLPRNILEDVVKNEEERIVELAQRYREISKNVRQESFQNPPRESDLEHMVPVKVNSTLMKQLHNVMHSIQSDYDTFVRNTEFEKRIPLLKQFRAFTSIPLHLLEVFKWQVHFYERHENGVKKSRLAEKVSSIVRREEVLKPLFEFGLYYSDAFLQLGNKVAEDVLNSFVCNIQYELPIPRPNGFHARPATYISLIVREHGTDVFLKVKEHRFNAKSVLSLLEGGGLVADLGLQTVVFEGDKRVLDDIKILADHNYCEDTELPKELNYLRILRNTV